MKRNREKIYINFDVTPLSNESFFLLRHKLVVAKTISVKRKEEMCIWKMRVNNYLMIHQNSVNGTSRLFSDSLNRFSWNWTPPSPKKETFQKQSTPSTGSVERKNWRNYISWEVSFTQWTFWWTTTLKWSISVQTKHNIQFRDMTFRWLRVWANSFPWLQASFIWCF